MAAAPKIPASQGLLIHVQVLVHEGEVDVAWVLVVQRVVQLEEMLYYAPAVLHVLSAPQFLREAEFCSA